jgi:hypothetical protein
MALKVSTNLNFGYIHNNVYAMIDNMVYDSLNNSWTIHVNFYLDEESRNAAKEKEMWRKITNNPEEYNKLSEQDKQKAQFFANLLITVPKQMTYGTNNIAMITTDISSKDKIIRAGYEYLKTYQQDFINTPMW